MRFTRKPSRTSTTYAVTLHRTTRTLPIGLTEIFDAIRGLVPFPGQGHRRPDITSRPLRFRRDYLIAYAPDEKPLWVVAVMHGRRDLRIMAAILRGRE